MAIRTYDPKNVIVTINGTPVTGFADGTGIKVSRLNDMYTTSTGMDGDTSRVKSNDKSGEVTLTLAQTSPSNDLLSDLSNKDEVDADLATVQVADVVTGSIYTSATGWVKKHPDIEFGKDVSNREWIMSCVDIDMTTKGTSNTLG